MRVAVIGTGGQGSGHVGRLLKETKGCRFVAACDAGRAERECEAARQGLAEARRQARMRVYERAF